MISPYADYTAQSTLQARGAFDDALRRARRRRTLARLGGRPTRLQSFDEERRRLGPTLSNPPTRRDIPLAAVTGSVDRSRDFTSDFLPLLSSDEERWTRVRNAMVGEAGVPPIVVYGLRGRYFVIDGHHRVSVAKRFGQTSIEAYVTEVTPVRSSVEQGST